MLPEKPRPNQGGAQHRGSSMGCTAQGGAEHSAGDKARHGHGLTGTVWQKGHRTTSTAWGHNLRGPAWVSVGHRQQTFKWFRANWSTSGRCLYCTGACKDAANQCSATTCVCMYMQGNRQCGSTNNAVQRRINLGRGAPCRMQCTKAGRRATSMSSSTQLVEQARSTMARSLMCACCMGAHISGPV